MDRFIVNPFLSLNAFSFYLKSNMDRFIADKVLSLPGVTKFKIQYG